MWIIVRVGLEPSRPHFQLSRQHPSVSWVCVPRDAASLAAHERTLISSNALGVALVTAPLTPATIDTLHDGLVFGHVTVVADLSPLLSTLVASEVQTAVGKLLSLSRATVLRFTEADLASRLQPWSGSVGKFLAATMERASLQGTLAEHDDHAWTVTVTSMLQRHVLPCGPACGVRWKLQYSAAAEPFPVALGDANALLFESSMGISWDLLSFLG